MAHAFRGLSSSEFLSEIATFPWDRRIWRVDMHHTFRPDHKRWREIGSRAAVEVMRRAHVEDRGFTDIAQHVSIMPDGEIWTGRDWNATPASVGCGMNLGVFMLEIVGNFDDGHDRLEASQLASTLTVIRGVQRAFRLPVEALLFHREVPQTEKTCPGSSIGKPEFLGRLRATRLPPIETIADLHRLPLRTLVPSSRTVEAAL